MRHITMADNQERQSKGGFALFLIIWSAVTALSVASLFGGKVALGVLGLLMSAGYAVSEVVIWRGSERAVTALVLAKPFLFGAWLIAAAGVTIAARQSLDWVVYLPLGVAFLGVGVLLVVVYRRSGRDDDPAG